MATCAGRNVKITASSSDFLGKSALEFNEYSSAVFLGMPLTDLLQSILPRKRLDELLASAWLQRRIEAGISLEHKEIREIIRLIAIYGDAWVVQLGGCFNLASKPVLFNRVLLPVYQWWKKQHSYHQELVVNESQLQRELLELELQLGFLQQQSDFKVKDLIFGELDSVVKRHAKTQVKYKKILADLEYSHYALALNWPNWEAAIKTWGSEGDLSCFYPVPNELESFWEMLLKLDENVVVTDDITNWLKSKHLCLDADQFIWDPLAT